MSVSTDIAAISDGGSNTAAEVRTALTSVLNTAAPLTTKSTPDTPDDEFDSSTLDVKWTAVSGSSGTVDLLQSGSTVTEVYDLTTRSGTLLVQVGDGDDVLLRQDYTLPDGYSIVLSISGTPDGGDNMAIGLVLNQTDSDPLTGEWFTNAMEQDSTQWVVQSYSSTSSTGRETVRDVLAERVYLRIMRDDLTYHSFVSLDGSTWAWVYSETESFVHTNLWIRVSGPNSSTYAPIIAIDWIRLGTNDFDPW